MTDAAKKSDLKVRTLSAIVMLAVAGFALWQGGWAFLLLVGAVGLGVLWEAVTLVLRITPSPSSRFLAVLGLTVYVGTAVLALLCAPRYLIVRAIVGVISTDIGAYFAGRAIGGPKIAPAISPSKTWAGLVGGMLGASVAMLLFAFAPALTEGRFPSAGADILVSVLLFDVVIGSVLAVLAQAGDFFESWLKRRACVKDSGRLIPGHGGLFDRVDGLVAVCFPIGLAWLMGWL